MPNIKGYNTVLEIKDLAGVYQEIAKCRQSDVFGGQNASEDVTHMRSPNRHTETDSTLRSTDPLKLDVIYDSTLPTHSSGSDVGFEYLLVSGDKRDLRVTLSNGKQFIYNVFLSAFNVSSASANNILQASATFMPTQAPA